MMEQPRIPLWDGIMGNCLALWNFKVGRPTSELRCVYEQAVPQIAMIWIKEVENVKSIDELLTSRSIAGQQFFSDFDVLDAMITSALKKLRNTQSSFRKRASVEEQRAQKLDRFLRGRQIAYMIYQYFRATGAYEAVQGLADLFTLSL